MVGEYETARGVRLVYLCPSDSIPLASYVFQADYNGDHAFCSCEAYRTYGACNLTRNSQLIVGQLAFAFFR